MIALTPEEADYMRARNKILAIREVRYRTGMGLKEAKDYVEAWDGKTLLTDPKLKVKKCPTCHGTGYIAE